MLTFPICWLCFAVDIVFFGEKLPDLFDHALKADRSVADLVVVMGSSLKVQPVASVVSYIPHNVPQILINREVVGRPNEFDIELLGDCDVIIGELCRRLGWELPQDEVGCHFYVLFPFLICIQSTMQICVVPRQLDSSEITEARPHRYLFPGAQAAAAAASPVSSDDSESLVEIRDGCACTHSGQDDCEVCHEAVVNDRASCDGCTCGADADNACEQESCAHCNKVGMDEDTDGTGSEHDSKPGEH